jgi:hypothetical protein
MHIGDVAPFAHVDVVILGMWAGALSGLIASVRGWYQRQDREMRGWFLLAACGSSESCKGSSTQREPTEFGSDRPLSIPHPASLEAASALEVERNDWSRPLPASCTRGLPAGSTSLPCALPSPRMRSGRGLGCRTLRPLSFQARRLSRTDVTRH